MLLACLILLSLLVLAAIAGAGVTTRRSPGDRLLRDRLLDRYVVTVESGETFTGLLAKVDGRTLVLHDVKVLSKDGASVAVDGEIVLRRDAVSYMQKPSSS